jgi:hypothetical protein
MCIDWGRSSPVKEIPMSRQDQAMPAELLTQLTLPAPLAKKAARGLDR